MNKKTLPSFPWDILIEWYTKNGRHHLPWRDYSDNEEERGYRVWLSEILLQQTQVDRVIPYFQKIREKYPTIHHLAESSYDEFFPYYQGMGYYSRARNILKTAKIVSEEYNGVFPRDKKLLCKLPGVGGYTSSAILAFGYGEPYLAWDTNLEKVFARYYNGTKSVKLTDEEKEQIEAEFREYIWPSSPPEKGELEVVTQKGIPQSVTHPNLPLSGKGGDKITLVRAINNALMDFASTIDLKNPENINWDNYIFRESEFYTSRGSLEPKEEKRTLSFPLPDASIIVILHEDHKLYYSPAINEQYVPFILAPGLTRDTRKYVQEYFRTHYTLELSVRPVHKKWLSKDGRPYIAVNAQIQVGNKEQFETFEKKEAQTVLKEIIGA